MCRKIAKSEGLLVGISSGATCSCAESLIKRDNLKTDTKITCIIADTGQRYLSVGGLFD